MNRKLLKEYHEWAKQNQGGYYTIFFVAVFLTIGLS